MENREQQLEHFFDQYASRFNKALHGEQTDIEGTASAFSEHFIEASPLGVHCGKNDQEFRTAIPKGYAFYQSIGITFMDMLSKEITILDHYHSMVNVHWRANFNRKDNSTGKIEFEVIYFLQSRENTHKIFAYITGDEQAVLKEDGLI